MPISSPRAGIKGYPVLPDFYSEDPAEQLKFLRDIADAVNLLYDGKINATGTFTLTASQSTTVVNDRRCGPNSVIVWMPTTANAGGEMGMYITNRGEETAGVRGFTVNHGVDARTDRTFAYAIFG